MKIDVRTVYHCEHCKKISLSKGAMTLHEDKCRFNPLNRSYCIGCKHLLVKAVEYSNTDEEFTGVRPRRKFTCNIDGKVMCHPKIRTFSKERQELIMSISQKIMPNMNEECRFYEDAGIPF